ncbi:UDP-N-acetylglucosamine transferase subunit ALG13 homolog [Oppia nitens]|uniref:UDP-N-acetylglucosamine transferase subunit ALG13 homolog n=1 Tax=Oppia nitens TaxID=1686743 RepID=UPI0023DA2312|nr:UDP-N-acetylglucosamine transferase subunit ALG13 homolog [Oppia nitens]
MMKWTNVLVTVGSTRFDKLIAVMTNNQSLEVLSSMGCNNLNIQYGSSDCPSVIGTKFKINITTFDYKNNIDEDIRRADVVVGHAGAGTALEVLRQHKPLLMVINDELMSNHQKELANTLQSEEYLCYCYTNTLINSLKYFNGKQLKSFPEANPQLFANYVDNIFFDNKDCDKYH